MKEFSLVYNNIVLNVICDEYIERLIKDHFKNHLTFTEYNSDPTYTLIISEKISKPNGKYYRMIDKWFDNATLDCYIDNSSKICFSTNFQASTLEYKNLLIQYFVANLFLVLGVVYICLILLLHLAQTFLSFVYVYIHFLFLFLNLEGFLFVILLMELDHDFL